MDHRESITNQTKVSLNMAKHLFSKESDKNVVFSPLSLQVMLNIVAAASEGRTQQQLLEFLRSKSIDHLNSFTSHLVSIILSDAAPSGGSRLSFTQRVWVDQTLSLQPSFKETMVTDYKATLASVDFQNKDLLPILLCNSLPVFSSFAGLAPYPVRKFEFEFTSNCSEILN
ncbi:putative Serpin family protein [Medicago truncatula]|uniref:Putative Serpin family protein n=1 Tax=Medicago truncatula TaxID=3880 RepID=A0A396J0K6_MEDTR|nr:putative Serpin family protein [Medicago truncatula]